MEEGQVGIAQEEKIKEDYYEVYGSAKLQHFKKLHHAHSHHIENKSTYACTYVTESAHSYEVFVEHYSDRFIEGRNGRQISADKECKNEKKYQI